MHAMDPLPACGLHDLRATEPVGFPRRLRTTLTEAQGFVGGAAGAFALVAVFGYLASDLFSAWIGSFRQNMAAAPVGGYWYEVSKTLLHNLILDYLALRLGYATFGLAPAVYLCLNGLFVGAFMGNIESADQLATVGLLVPHGVFELPALFLAAGLGMWLGTRARRKPGLTKALAGAHAVFLAVILPLAALAAMVETWDYTDWRPRFVPAVYGTGK
jgi:stage II sporulation protein M